MVIGLVRPGGDPTVLKVFYTVLEDIAEFLGLLVFDYCDLLSTCPSGIAQMTEILMTEG